MSLLEDLKMSGLRPTEYTYNAILEACAKRPDFYKDMYNYLTEMKNEGFAPDHITLTNLLVGCARSGDISTGELCAIVCLDCLKLPFSSIGSKKDIR